MCSLCQGLQTLSSCSMSHIAMSTSAQECLAFIFFAFDCCLYVVILQTIPLSTSLVGNSLACEHACMTSRTRSESQTKRCPSARRRSRCHLRSYCRWWSANSRWQRLLDNSTAAFHLFLFSQTSELSSQRCPGSCGMPGSPRAPQHAPLRNPSSPTKTASRYLCIAPNRRSRKPWAGAVLGSSVGSPGALRHGAARRGACPRRPGQALPGRLGGEAFRGRGGEGGGWRRQAARAGAGARAGRRGGGASKGEGRGPGRRAGGPGAPPSQGLAPTVFLEF